MNTPESLSSIKIQTGELPAAALGNLALSPAEATNTNEYTKSFIRDSLSNNDPDAIIVLSAGVREQLYKGEPTGNWESVAWGQAGDLGLHTGARTRVIAGAKIAEVFPDVPVVANSYNRNNADEPTMASVTKSELIKRGVDQDRIILEEDSFSTITQYIELLRLAKQAEWKNVVVTINEYYEPRATALFQHLPEIVNDTEVSQLWHEFKDKGGVVAFISSEPIMRAMSPHYTKYLEEVYGTEKYHEMVAKEAQGLRAIQEGQYKYSLQPNVARK